jgi:hypothetical protein
MIPIVLLVISLLLSLTITRIGTLALTLTGMSEDAAAFQANSAFYGVGFTTHESEFVVNHPVRRRVVMVLMVLGNLGVATLVATVLGSVMTINSSGQWGRNLLMLGLGCTGLVAIANSHVLHGIMSRLVAWALRRWTTLDLHDYVALLHLSAGYTVLEIKLQANDCLEDVRLSETGFAEAGILVLGIQRPRVGFIGAPTGLTRLCPGDTVVVYGQIERLEELITRRNMRDDVYYHRLAEPSQSENARDASQMQAVEIH